MQQAKIVLEWEKIQRAVSSFCRTEGGKALALSLDILDEDSLDIELERLREADRCYSLRGMLPIDVSADLTRLTEFASKGATLSIEELERIAHEVTMGNDIKRYFAPISDAPILSQFVANLPDMSYLETSIHQVIAPDLSIYDSASPELKQIRHAIIRLEKRMTKEVGAVFEANKAYLSDTTLTLKNGHYVLPVANAYKHKVHGIIQDISNSGETTFIEPDRLVELNNQMVLLKNQEREEIHRLLTGLSHSLGAHADDFLELHRGIARLDLWQAKTLFGESIQGHLASRSEDETLFIPAARHPLLDPKKVIPNDFSISSERKIIVISGPNAGGKTVALKTLGLLTHMFESGLPLPCKEGAFLPYYRRILLDIGDSQSLSDNLSTFSGHMENIAYICRVVGGKDLVLLDEVGTGTSPKEGEALALAILNYLTKKHCTALISSHFEGLKAFAYQHQGVENASMLFDEEALLPTYKFKLGLPGESYGLKVARRFGIEESIALDAENTLSQSTDLGVAEAIRRLGALSRQTEELKDELAREKEKIRIKDNQLSAKETQLKKREENFLSQMKEEKAKLLVEAEEKIDGIIASLRSPETKLHQAIEAKKKLEDLRENEVESRFNTEVHIGDYVQVPAFGILGRIDRMKGDKIHIVTPDGLGFDTERSRVIPGEKPAEKKAPMKGAVIDRLGEGPSVGLELNVIGMHVDETLRAVDQYLDKCRLKGFERVRIIHGYGSGALRSAIHNYLKNKPWVKKFELGGEFEGGHGATVVTLK